MTDRLASTAKRPRHGPGGKCPGRLSTFTIDGEMPEGWVTCPWCAATRKEPKMDDEAPRGDYSREELLAICERAAVPVDKWRNRDSASAQQGVGLAWVMLKAGADFYVNPPRPGVHGCHTDKNTIWVEFHWPGFQAFEYDRSDHANWEDETVYLPTPARLDRSGGDDWY